MKLSKILIGILIFSLFVFGTVSLVFAQEITPGARIALFHAAPDTPAVDIVVEEEVLFEGISFNIKTEFQPLSAGDYTISINLAGTNEVILGPVKVSLKQGRDHILFITGMAQSEPQLEACLLVKKTRPAYFRFYNTSPDLGQVDVILDNNLYFQNVPYGEPTKYEKIGYGNIELTIKQGDDSVVGPIRVDFEPGKTYVIVLLGLTSGTGGAALKVEVVEEN